MLFINNIFRQNIFHVIKFKNNNVEIKKNVDDLNLN